MKIAENKKAHFNYEILETFQGGLKLSGAEVKSLKTGKGVSLQGSYVTLIEGQMWLRNVHIAPYQPHNTPESYEPTHDRKILLKKSEIDHLEDKLHTKGLTIVPLSLHNTNHRITIEIALVRGKKRHDKRATIKRREDERSIRRTMKEH